VNAAGVARRPRTVRGVSTPPTHPAWIDLDGAVNVRDLGGLPVDGGGRTAPGVLLRADNLQALSAPDVERLVDRIGVRVVVDLRTGAEVELEGPGPLVDDDRVAIRHRSLYPEGGERTDVAADDVLPWQGRRIGGDPDETPAVRIYLGYLRDRPDSVVAALRDVLRAPGAALVHCAAGKDRTGMVCALALETVGVARAAVVDDYVATGERLSAIMRRLRSSPTYAGDLDGRPDDSHRPRAATMQRVLEILDDRDGGARGWLDAHGFGPDEQRALHARLVTDAAQASAA
jgi:protein-tyrosine phosphatase